MQKDMVTLHPNSSRLQNHEVAAVAVVCIDFRNYNLNATTADESERRAVRKFLGTTNVEFVPFAGASGVFITLANITHGKEYAKFALGVAINKHKAKKLLLTNHTECGAYAAGGYDKFETAEEEKAFHIQELLKAKNQAAEWFPDVEIVLGFMTVDGDRVVVEPVE
jgi:hypothetical protein